MFICLFSELSQGAELKKPIGFMASRAWLHQRPQLAKVVFTVNASSGSGAVPSYFGVAALNPIETPENKNA